MPPECTKIRRALILLTGTIAALAVVPAAGAATFAVNSTADAADAKPNGICATTTGACTLRAAVQEANATAGADTITLPPGTYTLAGALPALTGTVTISGAAGQPGTAAATTISGAGKVRPFEVSGSATVSGVVLDKGSGGKKDGGGAVEVDMGATLVLEDSTVRRSTAAQGGGIANEGTLTVRRSTISENTAGGKGGGIDNEGTLTLENSTLSGNVAKGGGGLATSGTATVRFATISGNQSTNKNGGGLYRPGGTLSVSASILSQNTTSTTDAHDCYGSPTFVGVNLVQDPQGCNPPGSALVTGDPQLAPLADNGGPTLTRAIPATSPAIDRVPVPCGVGADQRGTRRPGGASCDLGAYERSVLTLAASLKAVASGTSSPALASVSVGAVQAPVATVTGAPTLAGAGADNLAAAILRSVDIQSSILRSVTLEDAILRSVILRSVILRSVILRSVMLSDVPVSVDGGWDSLLEGTAFEGVPVQTLSLADVIDLPSVKALTLSQIDLSATALGSTAIAAVLMGDTNLASLPLTDALVSGTDTQRLQAWCAALEAGACTELGIDPSVPATAADTTLMSVALNGISLDATILRSVILRSVILRSVTGDPSATILRSVILRSVDLGATILRSVILRSVPALASPDCTGSCLDQTLEDAQASGSLDPDASLFDLLAALAPYIDGTDTSNPALTKLVDGLTLGDVLPGLLDPQDVQWNSLDVTALNLPAFATPPAGVADPTFDYLGTLTIDGGPADLTATLALPADFVARGTPSLDGTALPPCAGAPAASACADLSGQTLTVRAPGLGGGAHTLRLAARAGIVLETATATLDASATDATLTADASASTDVKVTEVKENGDTLASVLAVEPPLLTVSQVGAPADRDWYGFTITPEQAARGVRASAVLANLAFDGDLVLFGPADEPLRGAPVTRLTSVQDQPSVDPAVDTLPTETLADVPLSLPFAASAVPLDVSATRGRQDERIDSAELVAGTYYLQVSGFNGASSPEPYSLRLRLIENPANTCTTNLPAATPGALPDPAALPTGLNTVFLVNRQRLAGAFGAADADRVVSGLQTLADRHDLGVVGIVVPVDGDPAVRSAYAAWDAAACSPAAANDVVRRIGAVLDRYTTVPGAANVVVVGDDLQIPQARLQDGTKVANERTYGPSIGIRTPEGASLSRGRILSDNPYGATRSIGVNGRELFVPGLGVGRLVETPDQIMASLTTFQDFGGALDPSTRRAFVSGYDFLSDGSQAVRANLAPVFSAPDRLTALISETWTRADLAANLLPASGASPLISSVNAHFDHFRALPAFENAQGTASNLFTTADLGPVAGSPLAGTLIFSMGCHSGLSVSDVAVGLPTPDWAQALGARGGTLVGNTGFGYGDTETVALSERLMSGFSSELRNAPTIGQALSNAKRLYFAQTPSSAISPYDQKVIQQATFYGLPMYRVRGATPAASTTASTGGSFDVVLGDPTSSTTSRFARTTTGRGLYYSVDGATTGVQNRPIEPQTTLAIDPPAGKVAHGALITALSSVDLGAFDPVYFRPTVDLSLSEPELTGADAIFPAGIQSVTLPLAADDPFQRLVLVAGQFRDPVPGTGVGTQRLFTHIGGSVTFSAQGDTDFTAPRILTTSAEGRTITVTTDDTAQSAVVLYRPRTGRTEVAWASLPLVKAGTAAGITTWSAPLPAGAPDAVQFIVQAPDGSGNVAVSSNKGDGYSAGTAPASSKVTISLDPAPPTPQTWVPGPVQASLASDQGLALEYSVDGAPFADYTGAVSVSGDGTHTIQGRDVNGAAAATTVRIDSTDPVISLTSTPQPTTAGWSGGPVTVGMDASDGAGSGVVSLTYAADGAQTVPSQTVRGHAATLQIDAEGITEVSVTATDAAGRTTTQTTQVRIDTTDPTASIAATPPPAGGWWTDAVTLSFTGDDSGSGIASLTYSSSGAQVTPEMTVQGAAASLDVTAPGTTYVTLTATDGVGRSATVTYTVKIDDADPVLTITPGLTPNAAGWWNASVTLTITGGDAGSGLASLTYSASGAQVTATESATGGSSTLVVSAEGETSVTATATDVAGRVTHATYTIRLDRTAPTIAIRSPADGSALALGASVTADYSCSDALSGSPTCDGPVPSGTSFPVLTLGQQTFTVTSTDQAGNTATCSVRYAGVYRICVLRGDDDASENGAIPIKLRLCSATGANLSSPAITLTATALDSSPPIPNDTGNANNNFLFRYTGDAYTYNLQTKDIPPSPDGRHTLFFTVSGDQWTTYSVQFTVGHG